MDLLALIFTIWLCVCVVVVCVRSGKLMVRAINSFFDKIEDRFG